MAAAAITAKVALPDRDGLGLRLPGGHVQRHHLDAAGHQPVGRHRPQRAEPGERHHGHDERHVGRPDARRSRPARPRSGSATGPTRTPTGRASSSTTSRLGGQVIGTAETADEGWVFDTRSTGANSSTPLPSFARQQRTAGRAPCSTLLHRGVPPARRVRRVAEDGVQLRVPRDGEGQLGGDPSLHGGSARLVLGHPVRPTTTSATTPVTASAARRRASAVQPLAGRHADAQPDPVLRLDVRPRADGGVGAAPEQARRCRASTSRP